MFLKSIEVQGFKSFANKLTFEFNKGITGIVGPNGSGKSNIADAVRWVLGEQRAKQLRGSKMEDVIFAGTQLRKPLGFAYVALVLDNSDRQLSIDYDTVKVSRRVYRSGESEYQINGHNCRLRDIQELFYDTGIGKEGYSIIGQGQIDKILSGKPEDRRELFDEAVGIVKYKRRKALTEKNLLQEQENLSRVNDILMELEKQIGPLEKQSAKAKIYLELRDQLRKLDANLYIASFDKIKKDTAEVEEKLTIVLDHLKEAQSDNEKIRERYDILEREIADLDESISRLQELQSGAAVEKQRIDGEISHLGEKKEEQIRSIDSLKEKGLELEEKIRHKASQGKEKQAERDRLLEELQAIEAEQTAASKRAEDTVAEKDQVQTKLDKLNETLIRRLEEISEHKAELLRYETMDEQGDERRNELNERLSSLEKESASEADLILRLSNEKLQIADDLKIQNEESDRIDDLIQKLQNDTLQNRKDQQLADKKYNESLARYKTLRNISERYEGYSGSIRKVMEMKKTYPGIIGVVADVISTDKKYELAIETALGGSISNIVTKDEQTAKTMISYLKENRAGRATFLPLTSIRGKVADRKDQILREPGVLGLASELVRFPKNYQNLADYLLGRVFIVDHIDHALSLASKNRYSLRIVTLEGESLSPGGSLSGGAFKNSSNLLGRHREMDELAKACEKLAEDSDLIKETGEDLARREKEAIKQKQQVTTKINDLVLHENTVKIRLSQVQESYDEHHGGIDDLISEKQMLSSQRAEIKQKIEDGRKQLQELERDNEKDRQLIEALTDTLGSVRNQEQELADESYDLRVRYESTRQNITYTEENIARLASEYTQLKEEADINAKLADDFAQGSENIEEKLSSLNEEKEKLADELAHSGEKLSLLNSGKQEKSSEYRSLFNQRETLSETIRELDKDQYRLTTQKEKLEENRTSLGNYMWEEYGLTYQGCLEYQDEELTALSLTQIRKQTQGLKAQIKELGNVNVNAIEEYKEVGARYTELKTQHDDIIEAEKKLSGIILDLNSNMAKQFKENFSKIQFEFNRIFSLLFGGGQGTLELSEPDNILETGIIISVQPPGKKLQNMMQLSGGEKALTAIALLFAIQMLRPSPFCLLDEIEAALDDANVSRFAEYLHKLTDDTQFIVITHRRGTMKAADVLYGITMQEKGVSTLVSVNLIENDLSK